MDEIIKDTCAEIDSVLVETYALPLPVRNLAAPEKPSAPTSREHVSMTTRRPDRVLGRLSSARKKLREVGAGDRRLVSADGVEASRHATVLVDAPGPTFTRARLTEYLEPTPTSYGPFGQG